MATPIVNTVLGMLLMHGIWRSLNGTIPGLSVRSSTSRGTILPRFNLQLTNTLPSIDSTTSAFTSTTTSSPPASPSTISSTSSYVQPVIHLHPFPVSVPQTPQMVFIPSSRVASQFDPQSQIVTAQSFQPRSMIMRSVSPEMQVQSFLVSQASTLNPIRVSSAKSIPEQKPFGSELTHRKDNENGNFSPKKIHHFKVRKTSSDDLKTENFEEIAEDIIDQEDQVNKKKFVTFCYYLFDNTNGTDLPPSQIDPKICSHLIVGFAYVGPRNIVWFRNPELDVQKIRGLTKLRKRNSSLKIILSVRINVSNESIESNFRLKPREKLIRFARSLVDIVNLWQLDGIDLFMDDQKPATNLPPTFLSKTILKEAIKTGREAPFISISLAGAPATLSQDLNVFEMIKYAKFINIFLTDESQSHNRSRAMHGGLIYEDESNEDKIIGLNGLVESWINHGIPSEKLVLGLPINARTYNLAFPFAQGIGAPIHGVGLGEGKMTYTKVCEFIQNGAKVEFDMKGEAPFAHLNYDWVAFENEKSVAIKARYAVKQKLAGLATFSLNYDDWIGICRKDYKRFPLQRTIFMALEMAKFIINKH